MRIICFVFHPLVIEKYCGIKIIRNSVLTFGIRYDIIVLSSEKDNMTII